MCSNVVRLVEKALATGKKLLLLLDFDGTISEIVPTPDEAVIYPPARGLLELLASSESVICGVVTGRSLEDVKRRVSLSLPIWSGNHGFQVEMYGELFNLGDGRVKGLMEEAESLLFSHLSGFEGIIIENKGFSLSVHTRRLDERAESRVMERVEELLRSRSFLKLRRGKRVVEVLPARSPGKGGAFEFIVSRLEVIGEGECFPVYFGDDFTDIEVYERIERTGKGCFVFVEGKERVDFDGEFRVKGVEGVVRCLEELASRVNMRREK